MPSYEPLGATGGFLGVIERYFRGAGHVAETAHSTRREFSLNGPAPGGGPIGKRKLSDVAICDDVQDVPAGAVQFELHPEAMRQVAYVAFWAMVVLAVCLTKLGVRDRDGVAVDLANSHLVKVFGYNNICVNWDYTPARQLVALFYPFFEFSFVAYHVLSFLQAKVNYNRGHIPYWLYALCRVILPIKVTLTAWFRMIFVVSVEDSPAFHTIGFFGLQIGLILVALENILYDSIVGGGLAYPIIGRRGTKILAWLYFSVMVPVTLFKIAFPTAIFLGRPFLDLTNPSHVAITKASDRIWMLLVAVLPIFFAQIQKNSEPNLKFKIF